MRIEQIYCTHCTYGTSALEQREGELADRVLGYSARAGSLDRNELRNDYRAIERFLYYYLPSDTPPEDKQRLDAAAAPRRLFFCPAMGKLQMVGQVAYRQYDTAGRLGSYFAHVLFANHAQGNWSAADCLRLWHAPWIQEDSAEHSYKLPSLETLDQIWAGKTPPIGDDAVLDFLHATSHSVGRASGTSPPDGPRKPPLDLVDARWQTVPMQQRIDLLINTLQGLLNVGAQRRENILLVVEPGLAALVFYGVARLLPKSLAGGLSFSTYEPNAERLPVTLAATTFADPYTNDVRPDLYRRRGLVINTYQDRLSEAGPPPGDYARFIVDRLLEEGWPTVDRLLAAFNEVGANRPEDLELLSRAHKVSVQVLSAAPPADDGWRKSEVAVRYLQREVQHQLANAPAGWPQLHKLLGTPNHLTVLELIAGDRVPAELRLPAQFLLKKFPPEKIAELINSPLVAQAAKLEALAAYVTAHHRLPEGCQLLMPDTGRLKPRPPPEALLHELLARLPEPVLRQLGDGIADNLRMAWFGALVDACGSRPSPPLKKAVAKALGELSDAEFLDALARFREPIRRACPPPEPVLAKRLGRLLYELPQHPKSFEKWLSALLEWKGSFASPHLAEQRLGEWNKIRGCLLSLRESGEAAAAGKKGFKNRLRSPPRAEYKPLAEALNRAMPRRSSEMQELHDVAAKCQLSLPDFKRRLELAARHTGLSVTFNDGADGAAAAGDELFDAPGDEVARLHQRREQQARLLAMFRQLEEQTLVYADDGLGSEKLRVLQQVGQLIVGRPDFLGSGRQMVEAYFSNGGAWSGPVLLSSGGKKSRKKSGKKSGGWKNWLPIMLSVAAGVALLVFVIGHFFLPARSPSDDIARNQGAAQQSVSTTTSANAASTATKTTKSSEAPKPTAGTSRPPLKPPEPAAAPPQSSSAGQSERPKASSTDQKANDTAQGGMPKTSSKPEPTEVSKPAIGSSPSMPNADASDQNAAGNKPSASPSKPTAEKPSAEKSTADKPPGDKPTADKPTADKPTADKPTADKPTADKPTADKPTADKPAQENAPAPASETAKRDAPIIVGVCCALPVTGQIFRSSATLKEWTGDRGPITLTLMGLAEANKRLNGKLRLSTKEDGDRLLVLVEQGGGDDGGTTLAILTKGKNELSFKWSDAARSFTDAQQQLRRCVVEITGDDEPSYVSLMMPLKHDGPGVLNGTARLSLQEMHSPEFRFSGDDELRLGRGAVQFSGMAPLAFGRADSVATTASLHRLPEEVRDSHAMMVLWQNDKNRSDAELRLVADTNALPDGMEPVSEDDRKDLRILRDNIPKLRHHLEMFNRLKQGQLNDLESRIRALAGVLDIKNPPRRAGVTSPVEPTKFAGEVRKQILAPAEQRRDELTTRINSLDDFLKEQQKQLKELTTHAVTVTAMIYRRVERNLYAPCLILGDTAKIPKELSPGIEYGLEDNE